MSETSKNEVTQETLLDETQTEPEMVDKPSRQIAPVIFLILILFSIVTVISLTSLNPFTKFTTGSLDSELKTLKNELDKRRIELERQRSQSNLPNSSFSLESIDSIAKRITKDTENLAKISESYQQILLAKDSKISSLNLEITRTERLQKELLEENLKLHEQLKNISQKEEEAKLIEKKLEQEVATRSDLEAQLAKAKESIAELSKGVSIDDYEDLKRRLAETTSAKEFFEKRVNEIEEKATETIPPKK